MLKLNKSSNFELSNFSNDYTKTIDRAASFLLSLFISVDPSRCLLIQGNPLNDRYFKFKNTEKYHIRVQSLELRHSHILSSKRKRINHSDWQFQSIDSIK